MSWFMMAWKKYAVFGGRSRRKEYWFFILFNILIFIVLGILMSIMAPSAEAGVPPEPPMLFVGLIGIYWLASLLPTIAVTVRRLHDIGRSGWWILIAAVPIIGGIVLLVFNLTDSQAGDNQWGPNPKALMA